MSLLCWVALHSWTYEAHPEGIRIYSGNVPGDTRICMECGRQEVWRTGRWTKLQPRAGDRRQS